METNSEAGGTPDDVAAAAGAARRVVTPAWLTVLTAVLIAAIYAGFVVIAWGGTTDIVSGADCRPPAFNDLIHPRQRLMICAALDQAAEMRFDLLARTLDMSAPTLSKHLAKLEEAQYVATRRDSADSRRQWVQLTPTGRSAFSRHVAALRELTD
jgi:DNA-binding HxlR family transcriptional regulator